MTAVPPRAIGLAKVSVPVAVGVARISAAASVRKPSVPQVSEAAAPPRLTVRSAPTAAKLDAASIVAVNDLGLFQKTWSQNSVSFDGKRLYHRTAKELIAIGR